MGRDPGASVIVGDMGGYLSTYIYGGADSMSEMPVLGYHKIRGLAAPLRMMFFYKQKAFVNKAYAEDLKTAWFAGDKPGLAKKKQPDQPAISHRRGDDRNAVQLNSRLLGGEAGNRHT